MAAPDDLTPVAALAHLFQGRHDHRRSTIGIAVSGGGDSLALLLTTADLAQSAGRPIRAATVDHGLRPESADEARQVAAICAGRGIPHDILTLTLSDGADLQARARQARYRILGAWAKQHQVSPVLLGHTQDDVAESLVMRLRRGVGLEGLAEMPRHWTDDAGQTWARPFLSISRSTLRDVLTRAGVSPIEDPSNTDLRFERVEIRQALATLGWTGANLARSAQHLAQASQSFDARLAQLADDAFRLDSGDVILPAQVAETLAASEPDSLRRLLIAALSWVGGRPRPRRNEQSRLVAYVSAPDSAGITLAGCRIMRDVAGIRMSREAADCPPPLPFGQIWDRRWCVSGPGGPDLTIGALGADIDQISWRDGPLPRASAMTSPAVRRGDVLLAAPAAGLANGYSVKLRGSIGAALRHRRPIFN